MEVVAVSGADNAWRWRIVDPNGNTVEESDTTFPDITIAVSRGKRRLEELARTAPPLARRSAPQQWPRQRRPGDAHRQR